MAAIRRARLGDEYAVAALLVKLVKQHVEYDAERFSNLVTVEGAARFYRTRIQANEARIIVTEIDDEIVGFTYLEYEEIDYENVLENAVWLHDIYIESSARSAGIGKGLMLASLEAAKELGGGKLILCTAAKNTAAQGFFESFGFRTTMLEMTLNLY